jgi:HAMP domain-containing protein
LAAISAEGTTYYLLNGLIVCASLILLLPMLSIRVADGLTRPIKVLSGLTRQIAEGRYDIEIPFDRSDEIGELAVSLKRMAGELEATTV